VREFTHALGPLFIVTNEDGTEVIRSLHKSLRDWLTEINPATFTPRTGPYSIDLGLGNAMLSGLETKD
jgi:hypothetical protein